MADSFGRATGYAPLAARYAPTPNGRGARLCRQGKVIQVGFGRMGTVRMSVGEAREFAVGLMEMASHMLPEQTLVVKYKPPGRKHHRGVRVDAGEVMPFVGMIFRACKEAEGTNLFAEVGR